MCKKTIFTLLLFLARIGIIEQNKKDRSPLIINYEYDMIKKSNLHLVESLFEANEEKRIVKKIIGKKETYYLKKDTAHIVKNFFITFKR